MYALLIILVFAIIACGSIIYFNNRNLKQYNLESEKRNKTFNTGLELIVNWKDLVNKLGHKIKHYQIEDEDCLPLIEELYLFFKENKFDTYKLFLFLNTIIKLRFEKFIKNPDFAQFCATTTYFSDVYNKYDEINIDPKEYFERFIVGLTKHYNHSYGKSVGKEFIENSFDMEGFVKDIEQIHKMFVRIKTGA